MENSASGRGIVPQVSIDDASSHDRKDFWSKANLKFGQPWYRLEKSARIISKLARGRECTLLDIGCGPATLSRLLPGNVQYHGIDIAIHDPASNLLEADIVETPIRFHDKRFDIIIAQGIFEYVGDCQSRKFAEIAQLMDDGGVFITSYWNFGHRRPRVYEKFSNVQAFEDFRKDLARHFVVDRFFPTSYNWDHGEPNRRLIKAANMHLNMNIPLISPKLAVEYFFICSLLGSRTKQISAGSS